MAAVALALIVAGAPHVEAESVHEHAAATGLSLDDGKRWVTDAHTAGSIARIEAVLGASRAGKADTTLAELKELGARITAEIGVLIRGCTMTGQAHVQLHAFLSTFVPEVDALRDATDLTAATGAHANVVTALQQYHRFFAAPGV